MRKIRRIRKAMKFSESSFYGFPDPDAASNRYNETSDCHLFLEAFDMECEKMKLSYLNYETTAYVVACDDDVHDILTRNFDCICYI